MVQAVASWRGSTIVWDEHLEADLWTAISQVKVRAFLYPLLSSIRGAQGVRPALRLALGRMLEQSRPVRRVADIAGVAGCHRTTLSKQWGQAAAQHPNWPSRIEDLLAWTVLAHAAALARPDRNSGWIAYQLSRQSKSIARIAQRLTGLTLRELSTDRGIWELNQFSRRIVDPSAGQYRQQNDVKGNKKALAALLR